MAGLCVSLKKSDGDLFLGILTTEESVEIVVRDPDAVGVCPLLKS
jgi:hypothetical protein